MACITRCILRWGLISGLALGGATLLVGPDRVMDGIHTVRGHATDFVDEFIDDPVALKRQLEELAQQYPDRITEVRGEIAEVEYQLAQFDRDVKIAKNVVAATTDDLRQLKTLVAQAEARQEATARNVVFHFEGVRFDIDKAYTEAARIGQVRKTYKGRLAHDEQQFDFLVEQRDRLDEILENLQTEYKTYQAQVWQLEAQIEAVARNERLIELTKEQQDTLNKFGKYEKVGSLHQLERKLAELRTIQEAQLAELNDRGVHKSYEKMAEAELDMDSVDFDPFADLDDEVMDSETEEASTIAYGG